MRIRTLSVVAAVLVLASLSPLGPAEAVPTPLLPATDGFVRHWVAQFMSKDNSYTQAEAVDIARRFDVVVANWATFDEHVSAMKAANPKLRLIAYTNASFARTGFDPSWYARNAAGGLVLSSGFGTYMMNLILPAWSGQVSDKCRDVYTRGGFDGCFLDVLGSGPLLGSYLNSVPINSRTGQAWTHHEWIGATKDIANEARTENAGKIVIGNGLGSGRRYYDPGMRSAPLVDVLHGAMPELWLREPYQGVTNYRPEQDWKEDIDMVIDSQNKGTPVFTMTKLWASATTAQKDQWHEFAYASFLLATNGTSYFCFLRDKVATTITGTHPIEVFDIGTPTAPYYAWSGMYRRDYTGGISLVNPTKNTVTVNLGATYRTWNGTSVSSVTLAPYVGKVLKR